MEIQERKEREHQELLQRQMQQRVDPLSTSSVPLSVHQQQQRMGGGMEIGEVPAITVCGGWAGLLEGGWGQLVSWCFCVRRRFDVCSVCQCIVSYVNWLWV